MGIGAYGSYGSYGKKNTGYTMGSLHKRNQITMGQSMRKQALETYKAQVYATGPAIFDQLAAASEQTSINVVKQMQSRLVSQLQSKFKSFSIRI
jgi:hypothetical protein